jgi:isoleucyl-tRNA synthetase
MSAPDYRPTVFLPKTDFPMKAGLPEREPQILAKWQAADLYTQLREARAGRPKFIFHDGPPYANGDMHIGHALNHILKDAVVRTQTLLGKDAPYIPGWDCHGLPIEWKVEEAYRAKKQNKDDVPAVEFRAECRAYAQHWVNVQREQLKRLGISANWEKPYLTMDFQAEATIVSELLKFAESGQLYRGAKPVMWSPVEKTALADAEVEYHDITSTQIDVAFEITEAPNAPELVGAYAVIWTTTPWTIPVNQGIAYGPEIKYHHFAGCVEASPLDPAQSSAVSSGEASNKLAGLGLDISGKRFLVAEPLLKAFLERMNGLVRQIDVTDVGAHNPTYEYQGVQMARDVSAPDFPPETYLGSQLAGAVARHPMHHLGGFFAKPRPFLPGDFVTTDAGTGLVHMAPDHGEDDFALCKAHGINPVFAVEADGRYRADWLWLGGESKNVINPNLNAPDGPICSDLKAAGGLLSAGPFAHSYPHSWRSKKKVIFRCTPQWFVPMDNIIHNTQPDYVDQFAQSTGSQVPDFFTRSFKASEPGFTLREIALGEIERVDFSPDKGRNRIGAMVEGRPDWVLSRQRAWGVPITLFVDRKTGDYLVDKVINDKIIARFREQGVDAWTPEFAAELLGDKVDQYEQVTDILDVWFDSGCTHAFVLESGRWPEMQWPADLYLEGSDQHRGWFQSSLLESCGTRGRAPYNAILTHGFTMDASGRKMSKSEGNVINPLDIMKTYGADILRLWALSVNFTEDHRIGDEILKGVADQYRKLRNTFRYLLGALEGWTEEERLPADQLPALERWVLHRLTVLSGELKAAVLAYDFNRYTSLIMNFVQNDLSAFAMEVRKDSLYCDSQGNPIRRAWRTVLDITFDALVRWCAPVLVYTAEEVWLTRFPSRNSVHLLEWPNISNSWKRSKKYDLQWQTIKSAKKLANQCFEQMRSSKIISTSNQTQIDVFVHDARLFTHLQDINLAEIFICSNARVVFVENWSRFKENIYNIDASFSIGEDMAVIASVLDLDKCERCWRHLHDVDPITKLCHRCDAVVNG